VTPHHKARYRIARPLPPRPHLLFSLMNFAAFCSSN
jgi:hypothetical protein